MEPWLEKLILEAAGKSPPAQPSRLEFSDDDAPAGFILNLAVKFYIQAKKAEYDGVYRSPGTEHRSENAIAEAITFYDMWQYAKKHNAKLRKILKAGKASQNKEESD